LAVRDLLGLPRRPRALKDQHVVLVFVQEPAQQRWRVLGADMLQGRLQLTQERWKDARAAFQKAIAVESPAGDFSALLEKREARLLLARCLARDGQAADGIALARQVLSEADPADSKGLATIFVVLGEAQQAAGDMNKDALISYLTVDTVHNGVPEAHAEALAGLVELWEKENHPERARDARQALDQNYPASPWARRVREPAGS
jgi:tetratricopeptide (TPR) repeat protein